ncbi:hypothetical protein JCM5353_000233 [Sporobolomyces roseus]
MNPSRWAVERPHYSSGSGQTYSSPHPKPGTLAAPSIPKALERVLANKGELQNLDHDSLLSWSVRSKDIVEKAAMVQPHPSRQPNQYIPRSVNRRNQQSSTASSSPYTVRPLTPEQSKIVRRDSSHTPQAREGTLEMSVLRSERSQSGLSGMETTEAKPKDRSWNWF